MEAGARPAHLRHLRTRLFLQYLWRAYSRHDEIAKSFQILFLFCVARCKLEEPRGGAAEDVVLALLREERQVPDGGWQIEIPVRIVG